MFAKRLTRKAKVARLESELQLHEPPGASVAPAPTIYRLGGPSVQTSVQDICRFLPLDAGNAVRAAGGLRALVRARVAGDARLRCVGTHMQTIAVHMFAVCWSGERKVRIHARRRYHGKARYDCIQTEGADDGEVWHGKLQLLFACTEGPVTCEFALVKWLEQVEVVRDHVLGARHFSYWKEPPTAELLSTVRGYSPLVTSPVLHGTRQVFLLLGNAPQAVEDDDDA